LVVGKVVTLSDLAKATVPDVARNHVQKSTIAVTESPNAAPGPAFLAAFASGGGDVATGTVNSPRGRTAAPKVAVRPGVRVLGTESRPESALADFTTAPPRSPDSAAAFDRP
jgi:hypothetical protein